MKITPTQLPSVLLIEPTIHNDGRGFFFESFNQHLFEAAVGQSVSFVQDNHSYSKKGVLRGLHYQSAPMAQGKLVRVIHGSVFDVAVDIRENSLTFGQYVSEILSAYNKRQLWIPEGFAHGFFVLSNEVEFLYKTTQYWSAQHERSIKYNDHSINIQWPFPKNAKIKLNAKDANAMSLVESLV